MSATICPSCLSRSFEAGRCGKCGFAGSEYKPARTALPLGSHVGSYRIGVMKSTSRQSQLYAAAHNETSAPVIIEEFFPTKAVGRAADSENITLVSDDPGLAQRFEQGCLLIGASTQKRPLKRIDTVRANNTIYSVFEPVSTVSVAAQCEMMADNPYYFRDPDGIPLMTINILPIPPMPAERGFDPEKYKKPSPVTQPNDENDGFISRLVTESERSTGRKKKKALIIGIAAALILLIAAVVLTNIIGGDGGSGETPPLPTVVPPVITDAPEVTDAQGPTAEPTPELTPLPDKIGKDEFIRRLLLVPAEEGGSITGVRVTADDSSLTPADGAKEQGLSGEMTVQVKDGEVLRSVPGKKDTKLYFVVLQGDEYYRVEAGTLLTKKTGGKTGTNVFTPDDRLRGLGFTLWTRVGEHGPGDVMLIDAEKGKNWLETLYKDPSVNEKYQGDQYVAWNDGTLSIREAEEGESELTYRKNRFGMGSDYNGTGSRDRTAQENEEDNRPRLIITSTEGQTLSFPLRPFDATGQSEPEETEPAKDETNETDPEQDGRLSSKELIGCLRLTGTDGKPIESRKMKNDYQTIDDTEDASDAGLVYFDNDAAVCLCLDSWGKSGLIVEAKSNDCLNIMVHDEEEERDCRVRAGKKDPKKDAYVLWEKRPVELILLLWKDMGDLPRGTRLSFGGEEGQTWLDVLMNNGINSVLSREGVMFDIQEDPDTGGMELTALGEDNRIEASFALHRPDAEAVPSGNVKEGQEQEANGAAGSAQEQLDGIRGEVRAGLKDDGTPEISVRTTDAVKKVTVQRKDGNDPSGEIVDLVSNVLPEPVNGMTKRWTAAPGIRVEEGVYIFAYYDGTGSELGREEKKIGND